jgi:hypothetical protein
VKNRPQLEISTDKSFNTSQINLSHRAQTPEFLPKKGPTKNDLNYYYAAPQITPVIAPRKDEGIEFTSPGVDEMRAAQLQKIRLLQERL